MLDTDLFCRGHDAIPAQRAVADLGDGMYVMLGVLQLLDVAILEVQNIQSALQLLDPIDHVTAAYRYPAGVQNKGRIHGIQIFHQQIHDRLLTVDAAEIEMVVVEGHTQTLFCVKLGTLVELVDKLLGYR